jgi:hypothetical protein
MPGAVERRAGIVEIDTVERRREAVGIAFAADLAVGHDVQPGVLLRPDGEQRRVVLRLLQVLRRDAPEFARPYPRWKAARQFLAVDEPVGCG